MTNKSYAGYCTSPDFKERLAQCRGIIVVCGSCEQHGHHLPLDTDNIIGMELALRIAEQTNMLVMPPVNYGQVWSAKGFPGTVCLSAQTLKQILREIITALEQQGARNIVLMSGHNGNYPFLKELARELLDDYGWQNIWHFPVISMAFSKELTSKAKTPVSTVAVHAGEMETAMLLYLRPELVDLSRAAAEFPKPPADYPYRPMHWDQFVTSGSFGKGAAATAEFGREICEHAVQTCAELIRKLVKYGPEASD